MHGLGAMRLTYDLHMYADVVRAVTLFSFLLCLSACGGSSGGDAVLPVVPPPPPSGPVTFHCSKDASCRKFGLAPLNRRVYDFRFRLVQLRHVIAHRCGQNDGPGWIQIANPGDVRSLN